MTSRAIEKLIRQATFGRFGDNWKKVGLAAKKELQELRAEILSFNGDLVCEVCGHDIGDEPFVITKDDYYLHERCAEDDND